MRTRSFLFVVQGEGRGHMTQAMAIFDLLTGQGHEVVCVAVGSTSICEVPEFFRLKFNCPVVAVKSPWFSKDSKGRSIRMGATIMSTLVNLPEYTRSIKVLARLVEFHKPDVILNFYDPLVGLYALTTSNRPKIVSIAHQYVYLHPEFKFPEGKAAERLSIRQYTKLTAARSDLRLAISLYDLPEWKAQKLMIVPPVLRRVALQHPVTQEEHLLVYLVNPGYMQDVIQWHERHPEVSIHAFTDAPLVRDEHGGTWRVNENLVFHSLSETLFLEYMSSCKAMASTAGFESVAEAMYLGKPVLMVPVEGHYEQYCNARDAHRSGAGIYSDQFSLTKLLHYLPFNRADNAGFRAWVDKGNERILQSLESLFPGDHTGGAPLQEKRILKAV
jgi:uncharacterized protein (TIGR00661 family)